MKYLIIFAAVAASSFAAPNFQNATKIGDFVYFSDTSQDRTRADAIAFCEKQGGELAKIWNTSLYNQLRLAVRRVGSYWIDGIDREDPSRFEMSTTCSNYGEDWDLYGLPSENLDLPIISCLTLVKGSMQKNSKISSVNCNGERMFVYCQYPLDGCNDGSTEPILP